MNDRDFLLLIFKKNFLHTFLSLPFPVNEYDMFQCTPSITFALVQSFFSNALQILVFKCQSEHANRGDNKYG